MARLIDNLPFYNLDPLAEAVALLDLVDCGQFNIFVAPPAAKPSAQKPAKLDRSPDAYIWFWNADCR